MSKILQPQRKANMSKKELEEENKLLREQIEKLNLAYDNIIIIQESISKGIKQIKSQKRKVDKNKEPEKYYMLEGHLRCLYKMCGWINMQSREKDE